MLRSSLGAVYLYTTFIRDIRTLLQIRQVAHLMEPYAHRCTPPHVSRHRCLCLLPHVGCKHRLRLFRRRRAANSREARKLCYARILDPAHPIMTLWHAVSLSSKVLALVLGEHMLAGGGAATAVA
jgi:hypothetical protein